MTEPPHPIAAAFPAPPPLVTIALDELRLAATHPPQSIEELRRLAERPRPWDPPSCPPTLRKHIWRWLDQVAGWINEEHTWRVDRTIPNCWTEHPHIAHELATIACLRHTAAYAVTPDALEEWHRYTLPMFLERITQRIGTTGCPPGKHQPSPSSPRHSLYRATGETEAREALWDADLLA